MTFLNVAMLAGLVAAAIPILIHLFHRQRVRTVDFSSIAFIKPLHLRQSRAFKLRQILLLLVRSAIIALAVFAFARPAVQGTFGSVLSPATHEKTAVAIVLDNSYSMGAGGSEESAFARAKETGRRILSRLSDGDELVLVLTAAPPSATSDRPVQGVDRLRTALEKTVLSNKPGDIGAALTLASSLLSKASTLTREVYLMTDVQQHDWRSLAEGQTAVRLDPRVNLFLFPVPSPPVRNASLDAVTLGGRLVETRQPLSIVATVTNRSQEPLRDRLVSLSLNGVKRGSMRISAEPGKTGIARFSPTVDDPGHYAGYVELEEDDLDADNHRYFTVTIPDKINALVVADEESGYFLRHVLSPAGAMTSPVAVTTAPVDALNEGRLSGYRVVVLTGGRDLSPAHLSALDRFVASGGGLILFLGDGVNAASYNPGLLSTLFSCAIQGRIGTPGQQQSHLSVGWIDQEHPVFEVFKPAQGWLADSPRFFSSYRLSPGPQARVIARFSDGTPAIVEGQSGRGRALLIPSAPNMRWSDLPLKSLFVPLMHRGVRYVGTDFDASGKEIVVGTPTERVVSWSDADEPVTVVLPSGGTERLKPVSSNSGMAVTVAHTDEPGIYRIQSGDRLLNEFAVNVDTKESDPARLDLAEVRRLLNGTPVRIVQPNANLAEEILQSQQEHEVWKLLLWGALALILVESLLTRTPAREDS
ncbi:MAG: BatA domain-containing protein [Candidatus Latescibacteria bacterium]|nr:BatA domain-containing protein [Candidatus Latescibacterota bacterium]